MYVPLVVLLASAGFGSSFDLTDPLGSLEELSSEVVTAVLLTHLLPLQFLDKVPLPGQLEYYTNFLNMTMTKGEKHQVLGQWSVKWNVVNEIIASNTTYTDHLYAINDTIGQLLSKQIPDAINFGFSVMAEPSTTLEQDAQWFSFLGQQATIYIATALTKAANLANFNVAPGLLVYAIKQTGAALAPFTPSDPFVFIDPTQLFDLSFLLKVPEAESEAFYAILTNKKIPKAEIEKQIFAWAAKNNVEDDVKHAKAAYVQKLAQVKQLVEGFMNRLNTEEFPKIGETYADQSMGNVDTSAKLKTVISAIGQDFSSTYSQVAALLGFRFPFGPSPVSWTEIGALLDKLRGQ